MAIIGGTLSVEATVEVRPLTQTVTSKGITVIQLPNQMQTALIRAKLYQSDPKPQFPITREVKTKINPYL